MLRTLKKGCPFYIRLRLDKSGQNLIVKDTIKEHNHEIDKVSSSTS